MQFTIKNFVLTRWRYIVAVILIVVLGWYFFGNKSSNGSATLTVTPGDFKEQVSVSGTVIAAKDVDLGFAASGRISGVYATVGQYVGAGTIIAETENGDLVAALAQAQANLASLLSGTRPEEVAVASASVDSATSALIDAIQSAYTTSDDAVHNKVDAFFTNPRTTPKLAFNISNMALQTIVERDRAAVEPVLASWALLVARLTNENAAESAKQAQTHLAQVTTLLADANGALNQGVPDQTTSAATLSSYITTLAVARTSVNTAAATLSADSAALDSAQKNLTLKQSGPTAESVAAQEAAVRSAQAMLAKTRVIAPFGGVVTRMGAKVGEIVSPTTSEISMQSSGIFQIETFVPEVAIAHVAVGNAATTTLDAYGAAAEFPAAVISVDPAETVKDGIPTYKTTLSFLAADPRIRSGMTTNVVIETGRLTNAIVIPSGAVGRSATSAYVTVLSGKSTVNRMVETGATPSLGQIQILSGLSAGDTILLTPATP
jgi:multidrug efflux pump subunit AcrA (membrane-fusion protein)